MRARDYPPVDPSLPKFDPKGKLHEKHLNAILQSYAKIPNRVRALRDIVSYQG